MVGVETGWGAFSGRVTSHHIPSLVFMIHPLSSLSHAPAMEKKRGIFPPLSLLGGKETVFPLTFGICILRYKLWRIPVAYCARACVRRPHTHTREMQYVRGEGRKWRANFIGVSIFYTAAKHAAKSGKLGHCYSNSALALPHFSRRARAGDPFTRDLPSFSTLSSLYDRSQIRPRRGKKKPVLFAVNGLAGERSVGCQKGAEKLQLVPREVLLKRLE